MKIKIILTILIGALIHVEGTFKLISNPTCTYTGAYCPEMPCCYEGFQCKLTTLSLLSLPPELYDLAARNKTYKCLDAIALGNSCLFHEECTHIEHAKCINLRCLCEANYVGFDNRCFSWFTRNST